MQQDRERVIQPPLQPVRPFPQLMQSGNGQNQSQGPNHEKREQHIVYQPVKLSNFYHSKTAGNSCKR